ncbi:MAG TPA: polysaccharide deacetylase family protein [Burkholderiaceae bacterium]|nr:polysaccharide deacetylase family protein [Burkholderiaceae bacterium]
MSTFRGLLRLSAALPWLPGALLARNLRPGIRILMYHRVRATGEFDQLSVHPDRFEQQMDWLRRSGRVVSLDETLAAVQSGKIEQQAFAVTFDDGYLDNLQVALPILKAHRIPATIFITVAFCDQTARHARYPNDAGRLHLDWDEVRELAAQPGISIGSHTLSHPNLPRLPTVDAQREIAESRARIQMQIARPVAHFCYPSGDLGPREAQLARSAGYLSAVTVAPGVNRAGADAYQLRRTEVTDRDIGWAFALKLAGSYDGIHALLHRRRLRQFERQARSLSAPLTAGGGMG